MGGLSFSVQMRKVLTNFLSWFLHTMTAKIKMITNIKHIMNRESSSKNETRQTAFLSI